METIRDKTIIDVQRGSITKPFANDQVILLGTYPFKDSSYAENLEIMVYPEDNSGKITTTVPYGGYFLQLFLGDFTGNNQCDIMLRGEFGGTGSYGIATIYMYNDRKLTEIFNHDLFSNLNCCTATYLENYKVLIQCLNTNGKYEIDISSKPQLYLDMVYTPDGKVRPYEEPTVSDLNTAYPIMPTFRKTYDLLIQQRIVGVSNADTIGAIQTMGSLLDGKFEMINQNLLTTSEEMWIDRNLREVSSEEILKQLPLGSIAIPLEEITNHKGFLIEDLDEDGNPEIIFGYTLDGIAYLAILREIDHKLQLIDTYKGTGYTIRDLKISPIKSKKDIVVGWEIGGNSAELNVLTLDKDTLSSIVKNKLPHYSILELQDFNNDGKNEVILWMRDTGEAYWVEIYECIDSMLNSTNAYDQIYFSKLVKYYEDLLEKTPLSPIMLYYLAGAQYKTNDYQGALATISKALKSSRPYPSMEKLEQFQQLIEYYLSQS